MAHERLSPRQKMIGMMYLILTAMLALNVSKDAVEAFKQVDKSLTKTIANYVIKNNLIYSEFDRAAAENPAKADKFRASAYEIKDRADELYNFIQDLKLEIVIKAEKEGTPAIAGNEIIIDEVKKIDENNIPSEVLIGANESGKAYTLRALIDDYRELLITTLNGENPEAEDALRSALNTDDGRDPGGQPTPWANLTFQTLPLVATITILSKMQLDVRNAETEVLNHLYNQIDAGAFKFNKISAFVIPTSTYITQGSDYEAQIFVSATDTTQKPVFTVGGTELPVDDAGRGIYRARASTTGPKTWGGVVSLKAPDGTTRTFDFNSSYFVAEPNVVVSPTAMNVMYFGIDNPIDISVPGVTPDRIRVKVNNGTVRQGKVKNPKGQNFAGNWIVKPNATGQNVQVIITADMAGRPQTFPPYEFRVKPIPPPVAVFANKSTGTISRAIAANQTGVYAIQPEFDFDLTYTVTGFTVLYSDSRGDFEESSSSSTLTARQRDLINRLTRGKNLIIKDIRALGPDGRTVELLPVILKIE